MDGPLGAVDSAVEIKFRTDDLLGWDDLINTIRGPIAERKRIAGRVAWTGRILGPLVGPTFIGRMHADQAHYDKLYWDQVDGDLEDSAERFRLTKNVVNTDGQSAGLC